VTTVDLAVCRWKDDRPAAATDTETCLLAEGLRVDGVPIDPTADVQIDVGGFLTLTIADPPAELRDRYLDPSTHLEGTTEDRLVLLVDELRIANIVGFSCVRIRPDTTALRPLVDAARRLADEVEGEQLLVTDAMRTAAADLRERLL
jgi:hypothetical protein